MSDVVNHLDLFSGIGGFHLAGDMVWGDDFKTVAHVEIDGFCQKVLKKHWPDVPIISDIKDYKHDGTTIDFLTGGFPCQPFSCAGKQAGKEDDRYLWPEMLRIISEVRPSWIIGENVAGIINMGLDQVLSDLENEGYTCQSFIIPACAQNAPHRRDRVWIVGYSEYYGFYGAENRQGGFQRGNNNTQGKDEFCKLTRPDLSGEIVTDSKKTERKPSERTWAGRERPANCDKLTSNPTSIRPQNRSGMFSGLHRQAEGNIESTITGNYSRQKTGAQLWKEPWIEVATRLCRVDDGLPRQMDRVNRLKALGNAIVPQVVVPIMQAIKEIKCLTSQQN